MPISGRAATNFSDGAAYVGQDADDLAAVRQCLDGNRAAFTPIVERYHRVLYTVAVRMLGNAADAEDAAQDAFVKAYEKLRSFDQTRRFFSWIYRILLNECYDVRRHRRPTEPVGPALLVGADPDELEAKERRQRVQAAIVRLPAIYREVVVLRHFTELSYDEIGEVLHVKATVVKSRLHDARRMLSAMLLGEAEP